MIMKNLIIYIFTCLVLSCAVKGPPSGGPLDLNSPYIVSMNPTDGKINLDLDEKIEIIFDEMLDPNTIKSSVVVKPDIKLIINSFGKKIELKPKYKWPENSEFKIKLNRSIADYNGNNLNSAYLLTYSTSNEISNSVISGELFNIDSLKYCTVGLYELKNDSLQLYASIQNDINNKFKFNNIKNGEYVIIALMNSINDIYSDHSLYPYGIFNRKVILNNGTIVNNVNIYIDSPNKYERIVSIDKINNFYSEISLTNNEKLHLVDKDKFDNKYKNSYGYYFFNNSLDSINFNYLIDNHLQGYEIEGVYNPGDSKLDTISPFIINSYSDSVNYNIEFSEPILIKKQPFYIIDNIQDTVHLNFSYLNPKIISIENPKYEFINVHNKYIFDVDNNQLNNNIISINEKNNLNGSGNIIGEIIYDGKNNIIIEIVNLKSKEVHRTKMNKLNQFKFSEINPDKYKIWAYEDLNSVSDYYFNGLVSPFKLASSFGIYNEIIDIRPNWDIEGIVIRINSYE